MWLEKVSALRAVLDLGIVPSDLRLVGVWKEDMSARISSCLSHCLYVPETLRKETVPLTALVLICPSFELSQHNKTI